MEIQKSSCQLEKKMKRNEPRLIVYGVTGFIEVLEIRGFLYPSYQKKGIKANERDN